VELPRDRRRLCHGLLAVGLTCGVAFAVLAVKVASNEPNRVDREMAELLTAVRGSVEFRAAEFVRLGGSPVFVVLAAGALALYAWSYRRDLRLVALCILAPAIAGLLQLVVKEMVGPRMPVTIDPWNLGRRLAFPSGHATGAAAIATLVVVLVLTSELPRARRSLLVTGAVVYAVAVSVSRVVMDDHLTMDAIGGLLLGTSITALAATVALRRSPARVAT
jgi:membrane-associated phospholipid phosphatase